MIAANGVLYIYSEVSQLYAVKTSNDSILWRKHFGNPELSLSLVSNGNLYLAGSQDTYALRTSDGSQRWYFHRSPAMGTSSHPVAIDGKICFEGCDGLYSIPASDGKPIWHVLNGASLTDPVVG